LAAKKARGDDSAKPEQTEEKTGAKEDNSEKKEQKEEKTETKETGSDEGDAPSEQAIKDSLHQAEVGA